MGILIVFYSLISGFYLKELAELCNANELITNRYQCILAVRELKDTSTTIKFAITPNTPNGYDVLQVMDSDYPKGCLLFNDWNDGNDWAYWNTHGPEPALIRNPEPYSRPICKTMSI